MGGLQPELALPTVWSLLKASTEVQKAASPRLQMEGSLAPLFRRELSLN